MGVRGREEKNNMDSEQENAPLSYGDLYNLF